MSEDLKNAGTGSDVPIRKYGLESISGASLLKGTLIVVGVLVVVYLLLDVIRSLAFLAFLVALSIFFAYLLEPLVKFIRRPFVVRNLDKLMPRTLAILISFAIVLSAFTVAVSYLAPQIATQVSEFVREFPNYANAFQVRLDTLSATYDDLMVTEDTRRAIDEYARDTARNLTVLVTSFVVTTLSYLPWFILIPILAFFFLKDAMLLRNMFLACFPPGDWRARAESLVTDVNATIAAYTRAQLISCILIGLVCTLAFTMIGLDYALLLGFIAGILEFVPLLGPLTVGITATVIGLLSDDPWQAAWTAGFLILLRITHDYVTYPRIVRNGVHLHPFAVILSVLAGEQIAGVAGVFLSIPVVALITVFHKHITEHSGGRGIFSWIFKDEEHVIVRSENEEKPAPDTTQAN